MNLETLTDTWYKLFKKVEVTEYWTKVLDFLDRSYKAVEVLPSEDKLFYSFKLCGRGELKVIILQKEIIEDGYDWNGLYYIPTTVIHNKELDNISAELIRSNLITFPLNDLQHICKQGVLFLPLSFTSIKKKDSHLKLWFPLWKLIVKYINANNDLIILIPKSLSEYKQYFTNTNNLIITHPDYLSKDFIGCNLFKHVNKELNIRNIKELKY